MAETGDKFSDPQIRLPLAQQLKSLATPEQLARKLKELGRHSYQLTPQEHEEVRKTIDSIFKRRKEKAAIEQQLRCLESWVDTKIAREQWDPEVTTSTVPPSKPAQPSSTAPEPLPSGPAQPEPAPAEPPPASSTAHEPLPSGPAQPETEPVSAEPEPPGPTPAQGTPVQETSSEKPKWSPPKAKAWLKRAIEKHPPPSGKSRETKISWQRRLHMLMQTDTSLGWTEESGWKEETLVRRTNAILRANELLKAKEQPGKTPSN